LCYVRRPCASILKILFLGRLQQRGFYGISYYTARSDSGDTSEKRDLFRLLCKQLSRLCHFCFGYRGARTLPGISVRRPLKGCCFEIIGKHFSHSIFGSVQSGWPAAELDLAKKEAGSLTRVGAFERMAAPFGLPSPLRRCGE